MNKTLNFNIGNQIFIIEENAYKSLENYLKTLKNYFKHDKDSTEIMNDMESRMAEIFTESTSGKKPFINQTDIEQLMVKLGKTEDFDPVLKATSTTGGEEAKTEALTIGKKYLQKKLMRDPDDRILGGVCSGLGHYFGLSAIVVRLIVLALFLGAGFGLLIYILLWMIMPLAKSSSDKLLMKGLAIDDESVIGNIKAKAEPANPSIDAATGKKQLYRDVDGKIIAGVSSGLADYLNIDKVFVRLGFIALTIFNGVGILAYIIMWVVMPNLHHNTATPFYNINR